MIMWQKAKRCVDADTAAAISAAARRHGAQAVGVFVDEPAHEIAARCKQAQLDFAQLHGESARAALNELPPDLKVIYVMHATLEGHVQTELPSTQPVSDGQEARRVSTLKPV